VKFTDRFITRPVLATVVSLLILVLGVRALFALPVRQFPETENATISVTTVYYGASPDLIAGFITTPIEQAVAEAQGIDYLTSASSTGLSMVQAKLKLDYDANRALTEIQAKVSSITNQLPPQAQQPVLTLQVGEQQSAMYVGFSSATLTANQITDYVIRVVQPKLQAVAGVQSAQLLGGREYALRVWLDPVRLAAVGLTADDVYGALQSNNFLSALGSTKGQMVRIDLVATTDLHTVDEFRELVIANRDGVLVRLKDVANVVLGAKDYDSNVAYKGERSVFIGVNIAPDANVLNVLADVRKIFPDIQAGMPAGLKAEIGFDSSGYIRDAIKEVVLTLSETLIIVTIVIFLFLGTMRSVIIPTIAMPLSLIGGFFVMLVLGYSINLLTLLALVLGIGLVVDDAIIVVENVDRHMKLGKSRMQAAYVAARELAGPIIAISVVLIAVYVPIGFRGGLTGTLFSEFAFTLAGAVAVSAVVALTLSPMMCSRFLRDEHHGGSNKLVHMIDRNFEWFTAAYQRMLQKALDAWKAVVAFGFIVIGLIWLMWWAPGMGVQATSELAPGEDQSFMFSILNGPPTATTKQMGVYQRQAFEAMRAMPEYVNSFQFDGTATGTINQGFGGIVTTPTSERERSIMEIQQDLQQRSNKIAGANVFWINPPSLPGAGGAYPVEFVLQTTAPFQELYEVAQNVLGKAMATGKFWFLDLDLKVDKPQTTVQIDRDKVAALGLTQRDVGSVLTNMLGGGYVNYFSIAGRSYRVIPQVMQSERLTPEQVANYHVRTPTGESVPASTFVSFRTETVPQSINHFQRLNSATLGGVTGVTMGEALETLRAVAAETLPSGYSIDYGGASRQYVNESGGFLATLAFVLIIIYLVLAAQFESFVDPLIVIMSVFMAIFGAMVFMFEGAATLNVYTQVGLVTLVGVISKHGILIVQFANEQQRAGKSKFDAVLAAATIRLRPILMTTVAMAMGVVPLIIADGAGAVARNHMGIVMFWGISIGTLFTLFVVPAMYLFLGADHSKDREAVVDDEAPASVLP
jgi:multidrug efflux pump